MCWASNKCTFNRCLKCASLCSLATSSFVYNLCYLFLTDNSLQHGSRASTIHQNAFDVPITYCHQTQLTPMYIRHSSLYFLHVVVPNAHEWRHSMNQWVTDLATACNMSSSRGAASAGSRWMKVARHTIHRLTVSSSYDSSTAWHAGHRSTTRLSVAPADRALVGCCRFAAAGCEDLFNRSPRLARRLLTTSHSAWAESKAGIS